MSTNDVPPPLPVAGTLATTCPTCGSQVAYAPGTTSLRCSACGTEVAIADTGAEIREHSFDEWTSRNGGLTVASLSAQVMECRSCGARTESTDLAGTCAFCAGALVAVGHPEGLVAPEAVVPFHVDTKAARAAFGTWVGSRWFAPSALKKVRSVEGRLQGTYVPHWTYDAHTETDYAGQRGEYYYETVTRQVSDGKGGTRTETQQVRKTRWYPARGHVSRDFDDVLVVGSTRLDPKKLAKMGPWRLSDAKPFQTEYLSGYTALRYDVDPQQGSDQARAQMREVVEDDCRRDIGGDEQRVNRMDVAYSAAMFKLVLMPLWIASYLYAGKSFQVMVNANTGAVVGARPYSVWKIIGAVTAAIVAIAVIVGIIAALQG